MRSSDGGTGCRLRRRLARLTLGLAAALAAPLPAATLDGAVRLSWTSTEFDLSEAAGSDHSANLSLSQLLSPFLALRFRGLYGEQRAALDGEETATRSTLQPAVELSYRRPGLAWRVGWESRRIDSSAELEELDANALTSSLSWQPRSDFRLALAFRDATNESDIAALGRGLEDRRGSLDATYQRPSWSLGYSAGYKEARGGIARLEVEQLRQDLRLHAGRDLADGRVRLSFAGASGRTRTRERRGEGLLGEPVLAVQGLAAIDLSPSLGELAAAPGLIDGDATTATSPPIEIGGGNTFRNVGVDLGAPLPASRLEIAVDRVSGAQLVWDVYQSSDGVIWEPVDVVSRGFDASLLLYSLFFTESTQRYLKAVNVSPNSASEVRVTEVRALRELTGIEPDAERDRELYSAAANAAWQVTRSVAVDVGAETTNDESTVGGLLRRDTTSSGLRAGLQIRLAETLVLGGRFRRSELEERRIGGLTRSSDDLSFNLHWQPLPTVDALLTAGTRTDSDEVGELSSTDSTRLLVSLDLLDEIQLVTDLGASRLGGPAVGADRDTVTWVQRVEMRPRESWRVGAGYSWSRTESSEQGSLLLERASAFVDFDWTPGGALSLRGALHYYEETGGDSLRQTYGLSWTPGPKLSLALGWDQFEQQEGFLTANDSLTFNYLATSRMLLFATVTRSRTDLGGGGEDEITSSHLGASLSF